MEAATNQGMKIAGTKNSGENTIRKNSHLTWIDPNNYIPSEIMDDNASDPNNNANGATIAKEMTIKAKSSFVHESINNLPMSDEREIMEYCYTEDVQVAKYDADGRFDYHHDSFSRYLTVLTYLNGVGGTYFPFGGDHATTNGDGNGISQEDLEEEDVMFVEASKKTPGQDGILIVGNEGVDAYLSPSAAAAATTNSNSIIEIQPGDAISFYNYKSNGEKEWRSIHASLTVPREKWIATCWFRSEALTGPFGWLRKERLLDEMVF